MNFSRLIVLSDDAKRIVDAFNEGFANLRQIDFRKFLAHRSRAYIRGPGKPTSRRGQRRKVVKEGLL